MLLVPDSARPRPPSRWASSPRASPTACSQLGGGPESSRTCSTDQLAAGAGGELPASTTIPGGRCASTAFDRRSSASTSRCSTLADGGLGTSGQPVVDDAGRRPARAAVGRLRRHGAGDASCSPGRAGTASRSTSPTVRLAPRARPAHRHPARGAGDRGRTVRARAASRRSARPGDARAARATAAARRSPRGDGRCEPPPRHRRGRDEPGSAATTRPGCAPATRAGVDRRRVPRAASRGEDGDSALDRIACYVAGADGAPRRARTRSSGSRAAAEARLRRPAGRAPRGLGAPLGATPTSSSTATRSSQLAVRFALFHLMASVADGGEAAVGARGLTGPGYRGHVFWDARRLRAARSSPRPTRRRPARCSSTGSAGCPRRCASAARRRRAGARFPWESARTGRRRDPAVARDRARAAGPDPHRPARGAHRRRRRLGRCAATSTGRATSDFAAGAGRDAPRRDGPLLGLPDPSSTTAAAATSTA